VRLARLRPWLAVFKEALIGDETVLAGGVALFAMLATIPALAAVVALYGMVADPSDMGRHLDGLERVLPREVVSFLTTQLQRLGGRSPEHLGLALATTLLLALWSARSAARALMIGLNRAYGVVEVRPPFHRFAVSVLLAVATLAGCVLFAVIVIALPSLLKLVSIRGQDNLLASALRWPLLLVVLSLGLVALYRHAPSPREVSARRLWPGALVATTLWLLVSWGLSVWVDRVADYEILYGAFASVLVVLVWFYTSAMSILLGGLVNAELERSHGTSATSG
jgi:membrane protein